MWKDCPSYPGYAASRSGSVRGPRSAVLRGHLRHDGYYVVSVCRSGARRLRGVHQLVADAFLGPRPDGLDTNHRNGVKTDNRAENLEYISRAENCRHAYAHGLSSVPESMGAKNGRAKLTEVQVKQMRRLRSSGALLKDLASRFGVSQSSADYICRGVNWKNVR